MHPRLFDLNEAQALIRNTARDYAQKTLSPIAAQLDREARFPREQLAELAELGLMGVNVPEQYGGAAAGAVAYALAMMEIAQGCASTAVTMAVNNLVAETIVRCGTASNHRPSRRRRVRDQRQQAVDHLRRPCRRDHRLGAHWRAGHQGNQR